MSDFPGRGLGSLVNVIETVVAGKLAMVETSLPGVVVSFDGTANPPEATIDLAVKGRRLVGPDDMETYDLPQLHHVPVLYPAGKNASLYFDLITGDEVMVVFVSRDSDNAIQTGEAGSEPATTRRHHLMDAFAIPSPWSRPGAIPLAARGAGMVIDSTSIKLGSGAVQKGTTASRVLAVLGALEAWLGTHTHGGGAVPDVAPPTATLGALSVDKVFLE